MTARAMASPGQPSAVDRELRHQSAGIARWFATLLQAPPTETMLATLSSSDGDELLFELGRMFGCNDASGTLRDIVQAQTPAQTARRLGRSYTSLFEGISGPRTIPLYESVHVGARARVCQQPCADMQAALQRLDMAIQAEFHEPADHIAIELAALAAALDAGNAEESAALRTRLEHWTPQLRDQLRMADETGFYAAVVTMVVAFLSVLPAPSRPCRAERNGETQQETC